MTGNVKTAISMEVLYVWSGRPVSDSYNWTNDQFDFLKSKNPSTQSFCLELGALIFLALILWCLRH